MPLDASKLTVSPGIPGAGERAYPATSSACAQEWADAMSAYAAAVVPVSATVSAASATLKTSLEAAFNGPVAARLAAVQAAFVAWAATIGGGMAGFVATPPAGNPFAAAFLAPVTTRSAGVAATAASIDAWMRTGLAVAAPAAAVNWS